MWGRWTKVIPSGAILLAVQCIRKDIIIHMRFHRPSFFFHINPFLLSFFTWGQVLPAISEYTGKYSYQVVSRQLLHDSSPFLSELESLSAKPFHQVCSHFIGTEAGFKYAMLQKLGMMGFFGG